MVDVVSYLCLGLDYFFGRVEVNLKMVLFGWLKNSRVVLSVGSMQLGLRGWRFVIDGIRVGLFVESRQIRRDAVLADAIPD